MRFITNADSANHLQIISGKLKNADEVHIAVAFLKNSGLEPLLAAIRSFIKQNKKVSVIAGQHFGLTEPVALHTIRTLFASHPNACLHLAHANNKVSVFHPKVFLFRKGNKASLHVGSANLTHGGLANNLEGSLLVDATTDEKVYKDTLAFFQHLFSSECSEEATLLAIKRYESFYEKQRLINKKSRAIPERKKAQLNFNYENLLVHFKDFNTAERKKKYNVKLKQYQQARIVLDEIADATLLTQARFEKLLDSLVGSKDQYNLWHSGSLFRLRKKVYPHFKKFQILVKYIRINSSKSPAEVFARAKELVGEIEGAGINYITEIMMTYNNLVFANLNKNPITVLKVKGDVNIKATSETFNGPDYQEYCDLIKEICQKLKLKDMLEADSFFNEIYWQIKYK